MRYTLLYIAVFLALPLEGQLSIGKDTISIGEVIIRGKKNYSESTGYKKSSIDSSVLQLTVHNSLAELLTRYTSVFIKSYGMSGAATPSFRGTGASQTLINWNGVNINSPMLGQADISIIPAGLVDDVQVYYGGASMVLNNGGIGGAINLETKPIWNNGILASLSTGIGSFGEYSGLAKVKTGNEHFQTITKAFFLISENNFKYSEPGKASLQTRENNQINQRGFIQELYYRNRANSVSARLWYQTADRHLPPAIGTTDYHERQYDESVRFMLADNMSLGKTRYSFTGAWLHDRMNYTSQLAEVDSRNLSDMLVMKMESETQLDEITKLKVTFNDEYCTVNSNNYTDQKKRNTASVTASLERECVNRLGLTILLRQIMTNKNLLIPDFSAGMQFRITEGNESFLKANFSRNSRIPTMNDLFYAPYGNQDLKNEYAYIYELTYSVNHKFGPSFKINPELSLFRNDIKNMILWHIEGNTLSVDNVNRVRTTGLEASVSMTCSVNKFSGQFNTAYSFTKATTVVSYLKDDAAIGKQLLYIPENQVTSLMHFSYGNIYSSWSVNITGDRYITSDNSRFLPGYILNDVMTGIKVPLHHTLIDLNFNINNLFDTNYQSIVSYPMPGRSYSIKILFQFSKLF